MIYFKQDKAIAFLPVQLTNGHAAMPLGGPICDYQSMIATEGTDVNWQLALKALHVDRIDFSNLVTAHPSSNGHVKTSDDGMIVDISSGWDGYEQNRRNAGSSVLKRVRKKYRKMQSDCQDVVFTPFTQDRDAFDTLLKWKRDQWHRTGSVDVMSKHWIQQVITESFNMHDSDFGGELFTLHANGRLAAAVFGLRYKTCLHAWFVGYCHEFEQHSPGLILFTEVLRALADAGYDHLDLGGGDYRFKHSLATDIRPAGPGFVGSTNLATASRAIQFFVREKMAHMPIGRAKDWPAKAMRRMDVWRGMSEFNR